MAVNISTSTSNTINAIILFSFLLIDTNEEKSDRKQ